MGKKNEETRARGAWHRAGMALGAAAAALCVAACPLVAGASGLHAAARYATFRHAGRTVLCVVTSTAGVPGVTTADHAQCAPLPEAARLAGVALFDPASSRTSAPEYATFRHAGRTVLCVVTSTAGVPGVTTADHAQCAPLPVRRAS